MVALAPSLGLSSSRAKKELMHWWRLRETGPHSEKSITIQAHIVNLTGMVVQLLDYWLADKGETTTHFTKRLAIAQAAF